MSQPVIKDINIPSLPWEPSQNVTEAKDFNSPGDYIQQTTFFQFQVDATRIIFSTLVNVQYTSFIFYFNLSYFYSLKKGKCLFT